jgi:hypothetical protein
MSRVFLSFVFGLEATNITSSETANVSPAKPSNFITNDRFCR